VEKRAFIQEFWGRFLSEPIIWIISFPFSFSFFLLSFSFLFFSLLNEIDCRVFIASYGNRWMEESVMVGAFPGTRNGYEKIFFFFYFTSRAL